MGFCIWVASGVPGADFLADFAKLLERSKITADLANTLARRSYLTGEFRGRKVVVTLQCKQGKVGRAYLVVSTETKATVNVDEYEFSGFMHSRDAELALFALDAKHGLSLIHEPGCLKVLWEPSFPFFFPGRFEQPKWKSVLEAMHMVAGALERQPA